jgi:hypothetical protein
MAVPPRTADDHVLRSYLQPAYLGVGPDHGRQVHCERAAFLLAGGCPVRRLPRAGVQSLPGRHRASRAPFRRDLADPYSELWPNASSSSLVCYHQSRQPTSGAPCTTFGVGPGWEPMGTISRRQQPIRSGLLPTGSSVLKRSGSLQLGPLSSARPAADAVTCAVPG